MKRCILSIFVLSLFLTVYSQATISDVIFHYAFEDNLNDATNNNNDGTAVKTINYDAAGKIGSCLSLLKTDVGGVEAPTGLLDTSTDPFTVTTWVKIGDLSSPCTFFVVYKGSGTASREDAWALVHNNTSRIRYNFNSVVKDDLSTVISTGLTNWHHIATVVDPAAGTITTYVDGALDYEASTTIAQFLGKVSIGYNTENEVRTLDGLIDEFALFNKALTADDVVDVYQNGVPSIPNSIQTNAIEQDITLVNVGGNIEIEVPGNMVNSVLHVKVYDVSGNLLMDKDILASPKVVLKGITAKGVLIVKVNNIAGKIVL